MDYLLKNPKTGRLSYRRMYPAELKPHVPRQSRELKRSLGTTSITAPGARERYNAAAEEYQRNVTQAQKVASGTFDRLDDERIEWLAKAYTHSRLKQDEESRFDPTDERFELPWVSSFRAAPMGFMDGASRREKALEGLPVIIRDLRDTYGSGDPARTIQLEGENAEDLLAANSLRVDTSSPEFAALCRRLLVEDIALARNLLARFEGEPIPTPEAPKPPEAPSAKPASEGGKGGSFVAIAETVLRNPVLNIGAATQQSTRTALRFFRELHGELAPEEITRGHATALRDMLAKSPARRPHKERSMPLPKLVAAYENRPEVARLTGKTISQAIGSLAAIWNRAEREGLIEQGRLNPFARHAIHVAPPPETPQELNVEERRAIFALPIFTSGERPQGGKGEASYWIPLLLLWTGARPEEVAQLLVSDVSQDPDDGRWLLRITDEDEHPAKGRRTLKTAKTRSGRRLFPIPQAILDLGFLRYVEWLRSRGEQALFPKLRPNGERNQLFAKWGEWWSGYLRRHNAFPKGERRRGAREFRHGWNTAAIRSGISGEAREYIMGHSTAGRSQNVRYGSRSYIGREIDKLEFKGLDLGNVKPWEPPA